ncbi:hypothetical protein VOLCADRAFT_100902 [Volvox carteri f. nagariensis]|uniref:Serine-threonine/tyrosine-protein kinase catalytic domain-containing protein n=1 Tax=Volvox carteri f. nagariensis TaxID=3068 RepID=D8ULA9_VOLCA|nr:uncharacterized protein VOLCADRAFT_100902 [Volvox carteri f. nagariensis]EFJ39490.1 hypothetical protein VOLCADRAFT_100902 [Volvox carteri f. nagariensis]|eukprot:XP_002959445.1 hypothetical protein VOLCADRAFT_100902 [Volvox carteri f. nagariensis]
MPRPPSCRASSAPYFASSLGSRRQPETCVSSRGQQQGCVMLPQNRTHLSNLRMGTMFYMCPAVVMKGQVGPPSDVFSLGVMLWELYHGRRAGIRTDQGPRYSSIFPAFPPSCPETYRAVALHCLQRQPQNRPPAILVEAHLERLMAAVATAVPLGSLATGAAGDSFTGSSMLPSTQGHGAGASSA